MKKEKNENSQKKEVKNWLRGPQALPWQHLTPLER